MFNWIFESVLMACAVFMANKMSKLEKAVESLHASMRQIFERSDWHGKVLSDHSAEMGKFRDSHSKLETRVSVLEGINHKCER